MRRQQPMGVTGVAPGGGPGATPRAALAGGPSFAGLPSVGELVLGGKYRMEALIGAGGMGVVMAAEHIALGQKVAFKFLAPRGPAADNVTARFVREARSAARIDSEHVVRVSDVGVLESGVAYMLMERLEGQDLGEHLRAHGPLPVDEAVFYLLQACDAVAAAHAAGIIHRDLKPSNLFLARRPDGRSTVKVLDFGISKAPALSRHDVDQSLTRPGAVLGSPLYMSPEQVRNTKGVDARTDLWSLGMVLYELLVGSPMYNIDTLPALCAAIVADPPVPLRSKRPDAPPGVEEAVLRCTQKDPGQRFASVAELALAIAPYGPPEGDLLAARVARRLGASGEPFRPSGRISLNGTDPGGGPTGTGTGRRGLTAPAAVLSSARPPPAKHPWAVALAASAATIALVSAGVFFARTRQDRPGEPLTPLQPTAGAPAAGSPGAAPAGPAPSAAPPGPAPSATPPESAPSVAPASASAEAPPPSAHPPAGPSKRLPAPPGARPAKPASEFDDSALLNRR
ncbi:MAG TPA: serine/threonine-protein kinase [Polyangiaceae bacterium]|nr:serine/threonine-protein kinase [Polyangiaceae bacterium]